MGDYSSKLELLLKESENIVPDSATQSLSLEEKMKKEE